MQSSELGDCQKTNKLFEVIFNEKLSQQNNCSTNQIQKSFSAKVLPWTIHKIFSVNEE